VVKVIFRRSKREEIDKSDIGIRLLKLLLIRLYTMLSVNPLKWYEMLICTIMGLLLGLGIGSVLVSNLKTWWYK
jgi:hypothetical protein